MENRTERELLLKAIKQNLNVYHAAFAIDILNGNIEGFTMQSERGRQCFNLCLRSREFHSEFEEFTACLQEIMSGKPCPASLLPYARGFAKSFHGLSWSKKAEKNMYTEALNKQDAEQKVRAFKSA
ncbi:MAG: hypothetical protein EOM12_10535 [Verrucomicrobiae bacterium]|nr:hypothetical protein [Verrucomicrobiae bacterium]